MAIVRRSSDEIDLPQLIDITRAAEHLGVTVRHVRRLVSERRIPYVKVGHLVRFDTRELGRWIDGCRNEQLRR